ncbi:MAG: hypothetical protein AABX69_03455, partial [Nanoarchaeota archaeon]
EEGKFVDLATLANPDYPDPQSAPSYFGLKKYVEPGGEPVRNFFYSPLEQAIRESPQNNGNFTDQVVHRNASRMILVLQANNILTQSDLEDVAKSQDWARTGLVSRHGNRAMLDYFVRALEISGLYSQADKVAGAAMVAQTSGPAALSA